jgi:23S rRNA (uracil1939-C5)-methyltransferase
MARRRRNRLPQQPVTVDVESLGHDGRGIAHLDGKAMFIHGALAGERVICRYIGRYRRYDECVVEQVLRASPERVQPRCMHTAVCGGCALQHLRSAQQIVEKQKILLDDFSRIGKVSPQRILQPLTNESPWGYRKKARLGVKWVAKKGRVLVGFREKGSGFVADMHACEVLDSRVGHLLSALSEIIGRLRIADRIPQIEVAIGDNEVVLIFRILVALDDDDRRKLCEFARRHAVRIGVQTAGPESVAPLCNDAPLTLSYRIDDPALQLHFEPTDFTQVNTDINGKMIALALQLLEPGPADRVIDLFCGLGNFSLPLARRAGQVTGIEGDDGLVKRARENAQRNGLQNIEFHCADLYAPLSQPSWLQEGFNKALIDPPRSGAAEILEQLPKLGVEDLVYVSCYPSTLARDAGLLVHQLGYQLVATGVMDMFPHTAHVESIALFSKEK